MEADLMRRVGQAMIDAAEQIIREERGELVLA